ncbi:MAG: ImmA/IrrE family metallo-endopeptidase [Acidobacteria bacterium]|jgi:hypothetical protein|nr:ImmA/IrrE family metallo-endopeptidase [Acidobacteriota bacterium]
MRTRYRPGGQFKETPFYSKEEFERLSEDALREVGLYPSSPEPIRIERFIEKKFRVTPDFVDYLPAEVLGATVFGKEGVAAVLVSRTLAEEATESSERRVRTTLAHEGGHGLCQGHLIALEEVEQGSFGDWADPTRPRVLCRAGSVGPGDGQRKYHGAWAEYQANQVMSCLLLPRKLVREAAAEFVVPVGSMGLETVAAGKRDLAARELARVFDVNKVVVTYRLEALFPESVQGVL